MNVLITGANRGLGLALSERFTREGHFVFAGVFQRHPHEELLELAKERKTLTVLPMDVTDEKSVAGAKEIVEKSGALDAVISNAGILCDSDRTLSITQSDPDDFSLSMEINVMGPARVIRAFHGLVRDGGIFLTITSEAGSVTNNGTVYPAYSVSKAAANKLVAVFAKTVSRYRIYAVHPGRMNTEMGRQFAQIEPKESAEGIYNIATGKIKIANNAGWFINYKGDAMTV